MAAKRKSGKASKFADDAPWRAPQGEKPVPRISKDVAFPVRQGPNFQYAMSIMKVFKFDIIYYCVMLQVVLYNR